MKKLLILLAGTGWLLANGARADLSLEIESARLLAPGHVEMSMAGEYQHSRDGGEFALLLVLEVGVLPRLELLIEPTPYIGIYQHGPKKIHGVRDIEITTTFLALEEREFLPAIAFAFEWKAPTARNLNIGTRKLDFAFYFITSKRFGNFDLHTNVAYTVIGKPAGVSVKNTWAFGLAGEYKLNPKWDVFAEAFYTTSARGSASSAGTEAGDGADGSSVAAALVSSESGGTSLGGTAVAEVGGKEIIGTVGVRHHLLPNLDVFAVSVTTTRTQNFSGWDSLGSSKAHG